MNKAAIRNFAIEARRQLLQSIAKKLYHFGITEDGIKERLSSSTDDVHFYDIGLAEPYRVFGVEIAQRNSLVQKLPKADSNHKYGADYKNAYRSLLEEVAYTWFNRLIAVRFMEENGYLNGHMRALTPVSGMGDPDLLNQPLNWGFEFNADEQQKLEQYMGASDTDALFHLLFIKLCNSLNGILPGLFEPTNDYTELLFPLSFSDPNGVVQKLAHNIPAEDWQDQVQIIGWLYQYYNSEPKEQVFANLKKNIKITKENIPAATQLFTPDWIVRYMVENSLGRLWVSGHPNEDLQKSWQYYLPEAEQEPEAAEELKKLAQDYAKIRIEEIKCIDPCCGSGHILVYIFDVLMQIYDRMGYMPRDAVQSIINNNLFGLDIDKRAAQLSYFAVMMKARKYDNRAFSRHLTPRIYAVEESNGITGDTVAYFGRTRELKQALETIVQEMHDAKEYGSLVKVTGQDWQEIYARFEEIKQDTSFDKIYAMDMLPMVQAAEVLAQKYHVVVTNPPYMGGGGMGAKLSEYVKANFPDSKADLFACFMEQGNFMTMQKGYNCMVTMQSWMFLSSFETMRKKILLTKSITNLMHMENMVMGIAFGTAVTIMQNAVIAGFKGTYNQIKLCDIENGQPKEFPVRGNRFAQVSTDNFSKIPGSPVAYWVGEKFINIFEKGKKLKIVGDTRQGMATSDNNRFLRLWHEVERYRIGLNFSNTCEAKESHMIWFPYNKGGEYRKWYGNQSFLINYENDGYDVKQYATKLYKTPTRTIKSIDKYFCECLSWSKISSGSIAFRFYGNGFIFDVAGCCIFYNIHSAMWYNLAFLNTIVAKYILKVLSPTLNYEAGQIANLPIIESEGKTGCIEKIVQFNISISRTDWDMYETSWDFERHPLV